MSDHLPPPDPSQPPAEGASTPPPVGGYGQPFPSQPSEYGAVQPTPGGTRPGELMDRFLARLIDYVLLFVVYVILSVILGAVLVTSSSFDAETLTVDEGSRVLFNIVFALLSTAIFLGYFVLMESSRGQTLGKMAMKLQVVGPNGAKPTVVESLKRNVWMATGILAILGTLGSLLGSLIQLGAVIFIAVGISGDTARRQHFFDHFAGGTRVEKIG